jgi:hypothetical protein
MFIFENDNFFLLFIEKQSANQMWKIIREMPSQNYATLKYLFKHFKMIEKYQNENLMNSGKHLKHFLIKAFGVIHI